MDKLTDFVKALLFQ